MSKSKIYQALLYVLCLFLQVSILYSQSSLSFDKKSAIQKPSDESSPIVSPCKNIDTAFIYNLQKDTALHSYSQQSLDLCFKFLKNKSSQKNLCISPYLLTRDIAFLSSVSRGITQFQLVKPFVQTQNTVEHLQTALSYTQVLFSDSLYYPSVQTIKHALWIEKSFTIAESFQKYTLQKFALSLIYTNFGKSYESSIQTIQKWYTDLLSHNKSIDLPYESLSPLTRMACTDLLYIEPHWKYSFEKENNVMKPFFINKDSSFQMMMMHFIDTAGYYENTYLYAITIPLMPKHLTMSIIKPKEYKYIEILEKTLNSSYLHSIHDSLARTPLSLYIPKIQVSSAVSLREFFLEIGMTYALSGDADFSPLTGNRQLYLSDIIQNYTLLFSEKGGMNQTQLYEAKTLPMIEQNSKPPQVCLDLPFYFFISDSITHFDLMIGKIVLPY